MNWTPTSISYAVICGSKNGYKIEMYLEEIGLHAHDMLSILQLTISIIWRGGGGNDHFNEHMDHQFDNE